MRPVIRTESVPILQPKSGQVQLSGRIRVQPLPPESPIGSIKDPFVMLFHIELAYAKLKCLIAGFYRSFRCIALVERDRLDESVNQIFVAVEHALQT